MLTALMIALCQTMHIRKHTCSTKMLFYSATLHCVVSLPFTRSSSLFKISSNANNCHNAVVLLMHIYTHKFETSNSAKEINAEAIGEQLSFIPQPAGIKTEINNTIVLQYNSYDCTVMINFNCYSVIAMLLQAYSH